jgi:16S rRNA G966 N2-methylase RsmD
MVARARPSAASVADLVLADPPYEVASAVMRTLVTDLESAGWLAPHAHVVIERPAADSDAPFPAGWETQSRRMGDTVLWYGRRVDEDGSASERPTEGS